MVCRCRLCVLQVCHVMLLLLGDASLPCRLLCTLCSENVQELQIPQSGILENQSAVLSGPPHNVMPGQAGMQSVRHLLSMSFDEQVNFMVRGTALPGIEVEHYITT